jgi:hypothetical protein
MAFSSSKRITVPADVLVQDLGGEAVLLNLAGGRYFGLDEVGTRMWQVLTSSESVQAAYESLLSEYEVPPERLQQDLKELLDKLVAHGLVLVSGDGVG